MSRREGALKAARTTALRKIERDRTNRIALMAARDLILGRNRQLAKRGFRGPEAVLQAIRAALWKLGVQNDDEGV